MIDDVRMLSDVINTANSDIATLKDSCRATEKRTKKLHSELSKSIGQMRDAVGEQLSLE